MAGLCREKEGLLCNVEALEEQLAEALDQVEKRGEEVGELMQELEEAHQALDVLRQEAEQQVGNRWLVVLIVSDMSWVWDEVVRELMAWVSPLASIGSQAPFSPFSTNTSIHEELTQVADMLSGPPGAAGNPLLSYQEEGACLHCSWLEQELEQAKYECTRLSKQVLVLVQQKLSLSQQVDAWEVSRTAHTLACQWYSNNCISCHHTAFPATTLHSLPPHCVPCHHTAFPATTLHSLPPHCIPCHHTAFPATTLRSLPPHCVPCHHTAFLTTTLRSLPPHCVPYHHTAFLTTTLRSLPPHCVPCHHTAFLGPPPDGCSNNGGRQHYQTAAARPEEKHSKTTTPNHSITKPFLTEIMDQHAKKCIFLRPFCYTDRVRLSAIVSYDQ